MNCAEIDTILSNPNDYARMLKARGRVIVGGPCSYLPEEIIMASGAHPWRIFGDASQISLAESHLQAYCCSVARGILEEGLSGELSFLDGIIFPHTCDTLQRLSDIWRINIKNCFHLDIVHPVVLNSPSALEYAHDRLINFKDNLQEKLSVTINDADLERAIALSNRIREQLRELYRLRSEHPARFEACEIPTVMKCAMLMEREKLSSWLRTLIADKRLAAAFPSINDGKRVMLVGGVCYYPNIYDLLARAGGVVVYDDLCVGSRYFDFDVPTDKPPLLALAERIVARAPCPAKHAGLEARGQRITQLAKSNGVEGIIFLQTKFCDPHAFDYPYLKEATGSIPSLLLEIGDELPPEGQLRTRCEAFFEAL
ncbi:MAG: 2-hydroxyacyl-CoA dehydratase family protein [Deltaproteobacteria bacterium]|nr:2-hydroxyacyl-CoA dehydratase family protein [Deltaproteobacteria bacterium]